MRYKLAGLNACEAIPKAALQAKPEEEFDMKSRRVVALLASIASILSAHPASAHHSTTQFDLKGRVSYVGTVKKFEWQNPHVWVWIIVSGPEGQAQEVGIECAAPGALRSVGFKWDTLKTGDKVAITAAPLRDGKPGGLLVSIKWEDGRETVLPFVDALSRAGDPGAKAPSAPAPQP
jgi:Family of unknown function (DUF6152)